MKVKEHFVARQDFGYRFIAEFQKMVCHLSSYVYIGLDDGEDRLANAKSIIGVFSMQIGRGTDFTVIVMNDDENTANSDMEIIKAWISEN